MCVQEYFDCPMSYYNMKMDDKRIVMFEKGWGHFKVFNRLKFQCQLVSLQILQHKMKNFGTDYDMKGNCLAASSHDNWDALIHVWDLETKEKVLFLLI